LEVRHISIRNNTGSKLTNENKSYEYLLEIHTKDIINSLNKKAFFFLWNKVLFCRKRRTEISQNVIRVFLKKGDTIQKYINNISDVICQVNNYLEFMKMIKIKHHKKNLVLQRTYQPKTYFVARNSSIRFKSIG
jgi:hypothetical protein